MALVFPARSLKGATIPHTFLNQYLRDNLNGLHWRAAYQTSDLVKNSDTVLANCAGMTIPVASGDVWGIIGHSFCVSNATADLKLTLTAPGSSTGRFGILGPGAGIGDLSSTTFGTGLATSSPGTAADNAMLFAHITAGGAGNIQVQAAQNTSNAVDTTFFKYSPIVGFRISGPSNSPIPDFTNNQVLSAANLQTYLRDGLKALRIQHAFLREVVEAVNTEAAQDLTGMRFRVREGEEWIWFSFIGYDSTTAVDIAFAADAPYGSLGRYGVVGHGAPIAPGNTGTFGTMVKMDVGGNSNQACCFNGTIIAGGDGYVQLQGSQATAAGDTTTFHQDSFMVAFRKAA